MKRFQESIWPAGSKRLRIEAAPWDLGSPPPKKLNDHVYEIHKPIGRPAVELVFFHGLEREENLDQAHLITWTSKSDKPELWLRWLADPEEFPGARILAVSYDAALKRTNTQGIMDIFVTSENLVLCLTDGRARVGQNGCPVVLIGHCLGGLVIKEVLIRASSKVALSSSNVQDFHRNVRGIFFYATPHHGSNLHECHQMGSLFNYLLPLSTDSARQDQEFKAIRQSSKWRTAAIAEACETDMGRYKGLIVPEASARYDSDTLLYTVGEDHFDVCRPANKLCGAFLRLSEFIKGLLQEHRLRQPLKNLPKGTVGTEAVLDSIQDKLAVTSRLGIVGMGGIGKTTIARILFDAIGSSFDYSCFVDEVKRKVGAKGTRQKLQDVITAEMMHDGCKVDQDRFHWADLKSKRVLIILDDVEFTPHVMVMTPEDQFSEGSRLITTSRDRRFLVQDDFEFHEVETLHTPDAEKLLCFHALKQEVAPEHIQTWVTRLAKKCGNLPLALKVVGGHLYKRADNEKLWENVYNKIEEANPIDGHEYDGIWSVLKWSYDTLAHVEKEMFLDIATCFHRYLLEDVKKVWEVYLTPSAAEITWQNLVDKSLVSTNTYQFVSGGSKSYISMHELHRDLGRNRANPGTDVATHTRVFEVCKFHELHHEEDAAVKVLNIEMGNSWKKLQWKPQLNMQRWKQLRVIRFDGRGGEYDEERGYIRGYTGPQFLAIMFPPSLRYLHLRFSSIKRCPSIKSMSGQFISLEHLEVQNCDGLESLPVEIGSFPKLRFFYMKGCSSIKSLSGPFVSLEHLKVGFCKGLESLPVDIGSFPNLRFLSVIYCPSIKSLTGQFLSLERLWVKNCDGLESLIVEIGSFPKLRFLSVKYCSSIKSLSGQFVSLEHLEVGFCKGLESLPGEMGSFLKLLFLSIKWCASLKYLSGQFVSLELLEVELCGHLESLLLESGSLQNLHTLSIDDCPRLLIPRLFSHNLGSLKEVRVRRCRLVQGWYELAFDSSSTGWLKDLDTLTLNSSDLSLIGVGDGVSVRVTNDDRFSRRVLFYGDFKESWNLQRLVITLRGSQVPNFSFKAPQELQELSFEDCYEVTELPNSLDNLPALQSYEIHRLLLLETLPNAFGEVQRLERLILNNIPRLNCLPSSIGQLQALRILEISNCPLLENFPRRLRKLEALQVLTLYSIPQLNRLPSFVGQLGALQRLTVQKCNSLRVPLNSTWDLPSLKHLVLDVHRKDSFEQSLDGSLRQLTLDIHRNDSSMQALGSSGDWRAHREPTVGHLGILGGQEDSALSEASMNEDSDMESSRQWSAGQDRLDLDDNDELQWGAPHIGIDLLGALARGQWSDLECLTVSGEGNLVLPDIVDRSPPWRHVKIIGARKIYDRSLSQLSARRLTLSELTTECWSFLPSKLPESLWQFSTLLRLTVKNCKYLREFPKCFGRCQRLERLDIKGCQRLKKFPKSLWAPTSLRCLKIKSCADIAELPASLGSLSSLKHLEIIDCRKLATLGSVGDSHALQHLKIVQCSSLVYKLTSGGLTWPRLVIGLTIERFWGEELDRLPNSMVHLEVIDCPKLKKFPDFVSEALRLRELVIRNCPQLEHWQPSQQQVVQLEKLKITSKIGGEVLLNQEDLRKLALESKSLKEATSSETST